MIDFEKLLPMLKEKRLSERAVSMHITQNKNPDLLRDYKRGKDTPTLQEVAKLAHLLNADPASFISESQAETFSVTMKSGLAEAPEKYTPPAADIQRALSRHMHDHRAHDIAIRATASAGEGMEIGSDVIGYTECPPDLLRVDGAFALQVVGTSMEPQLSEGQLVFVNPRAIARSGDLVVIERKDNSALIKKLVMRKPDQWIFYQHNPAGDITLPVEAVAKVYPVVWIKP